MSVVLPSGDEVAHVLDHAEDRRAELLEHPHRPHRVVQRHLLRRRDDDRAGQRQQLAERQRHVAGAGRQVDDQVIELRPLGVVEQQLLERAVRHRAAPDERLVLLDERADRDRVNAVHVDAG